MDEGELTTLKTQATQIKSEMAGCPETCVATRFLRDFVKMFDLLEQSEKRCEKLKRRLNALENWQDTVDENNESR